MRRPKWPSGSGDAASSLRSGALHRKTVGRLDDDPFHRLHAVGMALDIHRLQQMDERHVQPVEPVGLFGAVMAVAVPAAARRQHDVAVQHRVLLAVNDGPGAVAVQNHPERMRRVAVAGRLLARQDGLVGADQGARRGDVVTGDRVAHDQVAPLGEIRPDQPRRAVHRRPCLGVFPVRRQEFGMGFAIQDRLFAVDPAGRQAPFGGPCRQAVEIGRVAQVVVGKDRAVHWNPPGEPNGCRSLSESRASETGLFGLLSGGQAGARFAG